MMLGRLLGLNRRPRADDDTRPPGSAGWQKPTAPPDPAKRPPGPPPKATPGVESVGIHADPRVPRGYLVVAVSDVERELAVDRLFVLEQENAKLRETVRAAADGFDLAAIVHGCSQCRELADDLRRTL